MGENVKYFDTGGKEHTDDALEIARDYADNHGVNYIVVASTTGFTAKKASEVFEGKNLVIVTHEHGFRGENSAEFPQDLREELESAGIKVVTAAHAMGGVSRLIEGSVGSIITSTLRMFSQGVKVCVEIASEAADAGYVKTNEDIISIAGTGRGADTVLVLKPANSRRMFETKIRKVLSMPM